MGENKDYRGSTPERLAKALLKPAKKPTAIKDAQKAGKLPKGELRKPAA